MRVVGFRSIIFDARTVNSLRIGTDQEYNRSMSMDHQYIYGGDGASEWHHKGELTVQLHYDDVVGINFMKVKAIVTKAKSYNVFVGVLVLY
jgi:hypothetical protein